MDYLLGMVGVSQKAGADEESLASVKKSVQVPSYRKHHRAHPGELEVHKTLLVPDRVAESLADFVTDDIPTEQVGFLESLTYLALTTVDEDGRPWVSLLVGKEGFIKVIEANQLRVCVTLVRGDPLADCVSTNDHGSPARTQRHFAALAVNFATRMRSKISGVMHDVSRSATGLCVLHLVVNEYLGTRATHATHTPLACAPTHIPRARAPHTHTHTLTHRELSQIHNAANAVCGPCRALTCSAP
jgi:hypothetical protein